MGNNYECIEGLDDLYSKAEEKYEELLDDISQPFKPSELIIKWRNNDFGSPLLKVGTRLWTVYKTRQFRIEIDLNIKKGDSNYFSYVENIINKRISFINEHFKAKLGLYFNDKDRRADLISKLNDKVELNKSELLDAIAFDFIDKCELLEYLLQRYYPSYTKKVVAEKFSILFDANYNFIKLNYGGYNDDVIDKLYTFLSSTVKYIDIVFLDFKAHFHAQSQRLTKIRWSGSQVLLCVIFSGAHLKNGDTVNALKTLNSKIETLLYDHFCHQNGESFDKEILRTTINKQISSTPRGIKDFTNFLNQLDKIGYL